VETSGESEDSAENGDGEQAFWHEFFSEGGQNYASRDASGMLTLREFDPATGAITKIEFNADRPSGFPDSTSGMTVPGASTTAFDGRHASG
jgi:hypothetical protein